MPIDNKLIFFQIITPLLWLGAIVKNIFESNFFDFSKVEIWKKLLLKVHNVLTAISQMAQKIRLYLVAIA